jgi:hypothetical protein
MAQGRSSNVLDANTFDEIYLKGIQTGNRVANSPTQRHYYTLGFDQAINLLDQYFLHEKISYEEARDRILKIQEVMKSNIGESKNPKALVNPPKAKKKLPNSSVVRDSSGRFLKR